MNDVKMDRRKNIDEGFTSGKQRIKRECSVEEEASDVDWRPNEHVQSKKRSISDYGTPEYHSMIKRPFIKAEGHSSSSDSSMINKSSENDDDDYVIVVKTEKKEELYNDYENEYDQGSDLSVEVIDPSNLISENDSSSSETINDKKSNIMTLQSWLELPAEEYAQHCANITAQRRLNNESDDNDDDSDTESQSPIQRTEHNVELRALQSSLPINQESQNNHARAGFRSRPREQLVNIVDRHNSRNKPLSVAPKVEPSRVSKWRDDKDQINLRVKNRNTRKQHNVVNQDSHLNSRRMTRSFIKSMENMSPTKSADNHTGKFVWGYCSGWWPAIIVPAEDGGLEPVEDKVCVYWISEDLISQLNEKTQVESFSTNLDMRLLKFLKNYERTMKDRKKACFVTLKLFSKYLGIPLLKPYVTWATKHLMGKTHLNDLRFYPLPKNIAQRLDQLKGENIKMTEKIIDKEGHSARLSDDRPLRNRLEKKQQDTGPPGKFPKDFVRKSTKESLIKSSQDQKTLPLIDQKPGTIVWGKIVGHSWWPAMILHNNDCAKKQPSFGCQWIIWYGDYRLSEVHYLNIMKFEEGIKKTRSNISQWKRELYVKAVLNACKDHCARLGYNTSNWNMDDVLSWASSLNDNSNTSLFSSPNDGRFESRYSSHIAEKLYEIKSNEEVDASRKKRIKNCDALKPILAGRTEVLEVLCIICLNIFHDGLVDHPFFECFVCSKCVEELKESIFAYGDDGKCYYCTLCSGPNFVVMCASLDCPRSYCTSCLKYLICPAEYNNILLEDPWLCFFCKDAHDPNETRIFIPRSDWKTRIGKLFQSDQDTSWSDAWNNNLKRGQMRVVSLFDGISTGLLILDKLGIEVKDYYASEIDDDAEVVSAAHFGTRICRLGDVRNINKEVIQAIAPIDLLIGGSPCNDLSIVNPDRLGLHDPKGTGVLFFDYARIKDLIIEANKGHNLFWLFENVASMSSQSRLAMNETLGREPSLIDASDFSPQHRPRLFWSNLPIAVNFPLPDPSHDLQSALTANCNRHALVKKIQTVTTRGNSLKQGVALLKPVLMNGEPSSIWITELEVIFGFPKHYTDVKNLSATKRQKLIGQAWSVQTVTAILQPLRYFFSTKTSETSD